MSRIDNAFTRSASTAQGADRGETEINVATFAPLKATLHETPNGVELSLSPIRAVDLRSALRTLSPTHSSQTLVFDVTQSGICERNFPLSLAAACRRLELDPTLVVSDGAVVLDDTMLDRLLEEMQTTSLRLIRVDGPIEAGDAKAIMAAVDAGLEPVEAEFRVAASLQIREDRDVVVSLRGSEQAASLVAENFRQYLAATLDRPAHEISAPFSWQVQRLLEAGDGLLVRSVETEIFSGSVDIGVSFAIDAESAGPASTSLIYDVPSDSWHDDD